MQQKILLYSDRDTEDTSAEHFVAENDLPILSLTHFSSIYLILISSPTPF